MGELIDMEKSVEESLKSLEDLIDYKCTYVFPHESVDKTYHIKLEPKLPEFSERNFSQFVKWFEGFEKYAKWRALTKEDIYMLLYIELSSLKEGLMETICKQDNITTLLQLEILLVKELFKPDIVNKTIMRVLTDPYPKKNINKLIVEFIQRCRELVIASLSFQEPNICVNKLLVLRLLSLLPKKLRDKSEKKITDINSISIKELIDLIIKEKANLDLELAKSANEKDSQKRKEESESDSYENLLKQKCFCCGEKGHKKKRCQYKNDRCENCNKIGHLSKVCRHQISKDLKDQSKESPESTKKCLKQKIDKDDSSQRKLQETLEMIQKRLAQLEIG